MWDSIKNFVLRHLVWIILVFAGSAIMWLQFGEFFPAFVATLIGCVMAEGVALGLSGLAVYAFTNVKFTKKLVAGPDDVVSAVESHGRLIVTGCIFLGTHFLIGIVIAGLYFAQYK